MRTKYIVVLAYLTSIIAANMAVHYLGIVEVGHLVFPAGAIVVGLTFTARDFVQREWGKKRCWYWMLLATAISAAISPKVALASGIAFIASEFIDWCVYTFIGGSFRRRIVLSNLFGIPVDSLIFVPMIFGWFWPAILGQIAVKFLSSVLVLPLVKK